MNVVELVYKWSDVIYAEQPRWVQTIWTVFLVGMVWMLFSLVFVTVGFEAQTFTLGAAGVIAVVLVGVFIRYVRSYGDSLLEKHGRN